MAVGFQGVPTILQVSDRIVRITGLSLIPGDSGIITLFGGPIVGGGNYALPEKFMTAPQYKYNNALVSLADAIGVSIVPITSVATAIPISIVKTGTKISNFEITFKNDHALTTSPQYEMLFKLHE